MSNWNLTKKRSINTIGTIGIIISWTNKLEQIITPYMEAECDSTNPQGNCTKSLMPR